MSRFHARVRSGGESAQAMLQAISRELGRQQIPVVESTLTAAFHFGPPPHVPPAGLGPGWHMGALPPGGAPGTPGDAIRVLIQAERLILPSDRPAGSRERRSLGIKLGWFRAR